MVVGSRDFLALPCRARDVVEDLSVAVDGIPGGAMVWVPLVAIAVGGRVISSVEVRTENILAAHLQNLWGRVRLTEAENIAQVAHLEAPASIEGYGTSTCLTFLSACNDTGILPTVPILSTWTRELANS